MVQVATPPESTVEEPHEVAPALPETFQVTEPAGVIPLTPVTVALKVMVPPSAGGAEFVTTLTGVALATFTVSVLLPAEE